MGSALTSIVGGIFDVKHYLHLQVRVLISKTERLFSSANYILAARASRVTQPSGIRVKSVHAS